MVIIAVHLTLGEQWARGDLSLWSLRLFYSNRWFPHLFIRIPRNRDLTLSFRENERRQEHFFVVVKDAYEFKPRYKNNNNNKKIEQLRKWTVTDVSWSRVADQKLGDGPDSLIQGGCVGRPSSPGSAGSEGALQFAAVTDWRKWKWIEFTLYFLNSKKSLVWSEGGEWRKGSGVVGASLSSTQWLNSITQVGKEGLKGLVLLLRVGPGMTQPHEYLHYVREKSHK